MDGKVPGVRSTRWRQIERLYHSARDEAPEARAAFTTTRAHSGRFEIYVTPFPEGGDRWLIGDGIDPIWSPDGREVYFRSGTRLMAARVDTTAGVRVISQRLVVEPFLPEAYDDYAIHPDGRTLVLTRPAEVTEVREVNVIVNWREEPPNPLVRSMLSP